MEAEKLPGPPQDGTGDIGKDHVTDRCEDCSKEEAGKIRRNAEEDLLYEEKDKITNREPQKRQQTAAKEQQPARGEKSASSKQRQAAGEETATAARSCRQPEKRQQPAASRARNWRRHSS